MIVIIQTDEEETILDLDFIPRKGEYVGLKEWNYIVERVRHDLNNKTVTVKCARLDRYN